MILDKYVSSNEMRAIEMNSEYLGVSRLMLMENAGRSIAQEVIGGFSQKSRILVACGLGGNGGDGLVAARHLASMGYHPRVLLLGRPKDITSFEATKNWSILSKLKDSVEIIEVHDSSEIPDLQVDVIIDALIGIGVKGPLKSPYMQLVETINRSDAYVISVDIPTGLNADTVEKSDLSINADKTLSFHKMKKGHQELKNVVNISIGIPPEAETLTGPGDVFLVTRKRKPDAHKGDFGQLLVIGGSETYTGAPALTALSAYAAGVDIVYVAAPIASAEIIAGISPSLITIKLKGSRLTKRNLDTLTDFIEKVDSVVMGPGLGTHPDTLKVVDSLIDEILEKKKPLLLDADALKVVSKKEKTNTRIIYTPHRKEFEILTGKKVEGDFLDLVLKEAKNLNGVILLKGNVDVISDGVHVRTNHTGNPGMTVGGTGDILAGICAGFMSMSVEPFQAACAGAFINGLAGDYAYQEKGYNFTADDVVKKIPYIIKDCLEEKIRFDT